MSLRTSPAFGKTRLQKGELFKIASAQACRNDYQEFNLQKNKTGDYCLRIRRGLGFIRFELH